MFNNRNKFNFVTICCWLSLLSLTTKSNVHALSIQKTQKDDNDLGLGDRNGNAPQQPDATVRNFSPRLEYNNEWRPVGRGDPLKNDPTYDYSPPALERVRYWRADNDSKDDVAHSKQPLKATTNGNSSKKEILMLGMPSDRHRGQSIHSETPHLQPKYTAIRRSYYAHQHQLPTHLMPPPMQTLSPSSHTMKGTTSTDYRHSMPSSTTTSMSMMHTKPYYSSTGSSTWIHSSTGSMPTTISSASTSSLAPTMMQHYRHHVHNSPLMTYERDTHHQGTMNQASYSHPSVGMSFTPNNFIESNHHVLKQSSTVRKPWLHELLQKEIVKTPLKSTPQKYQTNFEPISPMAGISTTHPTVGLVSTSSATQSAPTTTHVFTTTSPIYFTSTLAPTKATSSAPLSTPSVTTTTKRLLIPTTSNMAYRPTVAPMEMTTDALFKHYNQPEKPLLGPMYLIIEGHSKVKKYGKNEFDPHRPKIVPIIPKREPVVRMADPIEKRGTKETFQVKHLHTKTTPIAETTTTAGTTAAPRTTTAATTKTPIVGFKQITKTTTKPPTLTTTSKTAIESTTQSPTVESSNSMQGILSFLDSSLSSLFHEEPSAPGSEQISAQQSSKNNVIFVTTTPGPTKLLPIITKTSTSPKLPSDVEARIGAHGTSIESLIDADGPVDDITTEPALRDVRQVFDYDQLPELRLKDRMDVAVDDDDDNDDNDELVDTLNDASVEDIDMEDVENLAADDEYEDENHQLIKRIDKLVDDVDDDDNEEIEFEELVSTEIDDDNDDEDDALEMRRTKEA